MVAKDTDHDRLIRVEEQVITCVKGIDEVKRLIQLPAVCPPTCQNALSVDGLRLAALEELTKPAALDARFASNLTQKIVYAFAALILSGAAATFIYVIGWRTK